MVIPIKTAVVNQITKISTYRVKEITFPLGKVSFVKSYGRTDVIPVHPGQRTPDPTFGSTQRDPSLSAVEVYSNFNGLKLVKKYEFNYSYFNSGVSSSPLNYLRLKLLSVKEANVQTTGYKPAYTFTYNESISFGTFGGITLSLPSKLSTGKDHWGYCNNKNGSSLVNLPTKEQATVNGDIVKFPGLDRETDVNYLQAGMLTKITYPTGGFSEFTFEPHDYYSLKHSDVQKEVGGLRIKQIRVSDGVNTAKDMYTVYKYLRNNSQDNFTTESSGVLMEDVMYTRVPSSTTAGWPVFRSASNILPMGSHYSGNTVGYSEVTVLQGLNGELGKTIYRFHALPNYHYDDFTPSNFSPTAYYQFVYDNIQYRTPVFSSETSTNKKYLYVFNGLVKSSKSFKNTGSGFIPVSEVETGYNGFDNSLIANATLAYNVEMKGDLVKETGVQCCSNQTPTYTCSNQTFVNDYSIEKVEILTYRTPYLKLKQTLLKEYIYDQVTQVKKFIKESTFEFANDAHYQLTKACYNDPNNPDEITCTEYYYPADYINIGSNGAIPIPAMGKEDAYNYRHIHNIPVETLVKRKDNGVFKIIGGTVHKFKYAISNEYWLYPIVIDETYNLETATPLSDDGTNFYKSINSSWNGNFLFDTRYYSRQAKFNTYDAKGNVVETLNKIDQPSSVIYGYDKNIPVAKAANAYRSQISYTGFESGTSPDDDGWNIGTSSLMDVANPAHKPYVHSGRYSLKTVNWDVALKEITPNPQTGKYKISCYAKTDDPAGLAGWLIIYTKIQNDNSHVQYPNIPEASRSVGLSHSNGKWQYYEVIIDLDYIRQSQNIPPSTVLTLRAFIGPNGSATPVYVDEIRIHPVDAQMETYAFKPLVGPLSSTDINSRTTHTEYDGFQRVNLIRDEDRNILKKYNYVYKQ